MPQTRRTVVRASWAIVMSAAAWAPALASPAANSTTLSRIARTSVLNIGYIPSPGTFAFQDASGKTTGYSIDLCLQVAEQVRKTLGKPDVKVAFHPVEPAQRIPRLKAGTIDISCGSDTNTAARQKEVDFSYTVFTTGVRFLARAPFAGQGANDLWRKRVAVTRGTTAHDVMERMRSEQEAVPVVVNEHAEGVRLVEQGQVDAFAHDEVLLYELRERSPQRQRLVVTGKFMTVEPYAFMLPKGDAGFQAVVDKTLLGLMQSGEIHTVYRKWFDTEQLRVPMNVYMKENIKYPNRYGAP